MSSKNKNVISYLWWILILGLCTLSAFIAVIWSENEAIREMATSAFGGGIIGCVILFYEQFREERREELQNERDIKQADRLQKAADKGTDIRSTADILLKELKPIYDQYFIHILHKGKNYCPDFGEVHNELLPRLDTCKHYVYRTKDRTLIEKWKKLDSEVRDRRVFLLEQKKKPESDYDLEAQELIKKTADTALDNLINYSESILTMDG